jgi:non-heme Fe2+,alpha-ketoglutarate-dependent halogenase
MSRTTDLTNGMDRVLEFFPTSNTDPQKLTLDQIQHFNEKGYLTSLDVFDEAEVSENRAYFNQLMDKASAVGHNSYSIYGWQTHCSGLYDLVVQRRILDYLQDLLGENLVCWGVHFFCKMPRDTQRVSWHQDAAYWPLTPSKTLTVWLAIDDVDEENGAMRVIPGSHRHGEIAFEESKSEENNILSTTVKSPETYGDEPVSIALNAGQIEMHSDLLLHGSEPNPSSRRRCGLVMRYISPDVRALDDFWRQKSIICCGGDASGHWNHNPRPDGDQIPEFKP